MRLVRVGRAVVLHGVDGAITGPGNRNRVQGRYPDLQMQVYIALQRELERPLSGELTWDRVLEPTIEGGE